MTWACSGENLLMTVIQGSVHDQGHRCPLPSPPRDPSRKDNGEESPSHSSVGGEPGQACGLRHQAPVRIQLLDVRENWASVRRLQTLTSYTTPSQIACKAMAVFIFRAICLRTLRDRLEHDAMIFLEDFVPGFAFTEVEGTPVTGERRHARGRNSGEPVAARASGDVYVSYVWPDRHQCTREAAGPSGVFWVHAYGQSLGTSTCVWGAR